MKLSKRFFKELPRKYATVIYEGILTKKILEELPNGFLKLISESSMKFLKNISEHVPQKLPKKFKKGITEDLKTKLPKKVLRVAKAIRKRKGITKKGKEIADGVPETFDKEVPKRITEACPKSFRRKSSGIAEEVKKKIQKLHRFICCYRINFWVNSRKKSQKNSRENNQKKLFKQF